MRFNHVLLFLMAVSALSAFVMPPGLGDSFRGKMDGLFAPVASPVRSLAHAIDGRFSLPRQRPSEENSKRTPEQLRDENESLKYQVARLTAENEDLLSKLNVQTQLGDLGKLCRVVQVIGGDVGTQQTLRLQSIAANGLLPNMPVLYQNGLVGRIDYGAARVRLITDTASTVTAEFRRFQKETGELLRLPHAPKPVQGTGDGKMMIKSFKVADLEQAGHPNLKLSVGDQVMLRDRDFPSEIQGKKLGEIEAITPSRTPGFVNLVIRPDQDLMKLREVMVMVKR